MKKICLIYLIPFLMLVQARAQNAYWERSAQPDGGEFNLVKAPDGSFYAVEIHGNWQETYRSVDQGMSWQQITALQQFFPGEKKSELRVTEAGNIYVKIPSQQAIYKTGDDGQSWSTADVFDVEFADGVQLKKENASILRSTDGGLNWVTVLNYPPGTIYSQNLNNTTYGGLLFECKRRVANGDSISTLYRSVDQGQNWSAQDVDPSFENFFIGPSGVIFCNREYAVYRSGDGGVSFQITGVQDTYAPSFTVLPGNRILMQPYYGALLYSDDDGLNWNTLATPDEGSGGYFQPLKALADGTILKNHRDALFRSSDGGLSWQFSSRGMHAATVYEAFYPADSSVFMQTQAGLLKTSDGGATWDLFHRNNAVDFNPYYAFDGNGIAVVQDNQLFWSENGGVFTDVTPPDGLDQFSYAANFSLNPYTGHFFIITPKGLERSVDHGQTWQIVLDSMYGTVWGFHPSGRIIGASWQGEVVISDDNGLSWSSRSIAGNPTVAAIRVAPNGDLYLVAYLNDSQVFIWKSEDAGETWIRLPQEAPVNLWWLPLFKIAANGHLYIAANEGIMLSANGGVSWQNIPHPLGDNFSSPITCLAISPDQRLVCGTNHYGLYSSLHTISLGATIEGFVRVDGDADCSTPDAQSPLKNRVIKAAGDQFDYFTTTDAGGRYTFFVDTGAYDVSMHGMNQFWWAYCDSIKNVHLSDYNTTDTAGFSALTLSYCPLMSVHVGIPLLRRCFDNAVFVQYCNQGTLPAEDSWVEVELDPELTLVNADLPYSDQGNNRFRFFTGHVESGDCGDFRMTVTVNCDGTVIGQTHCITAHGFPDTLCSPAPLWSGANIEASVACQDTVVQFKLQNTGSAASQTLGYIIIEDDVVMLTGQGQYNPGESIDLSLPAVGHTLRIESEQEPGHPFSYRAIAFEEGCGGFESLGFINRFSVNGVSPSWYQACRENVGSYDPNDKQGFPQGAGAEHRIRPGQPIEYMIRFQNTGNDTAFTVVIADTLSAWLDPVSVIPGVASHPYTWQLSGQNALRFTFANILLPDSTTNPAGSQGFMTFSIAQKPDVPLGTQILNDAAIFFDFNDPVITNETWHTVGLDLISETTEPLRRNDDGKVDVSPNPAADFVRFHLKNGDFKAHRLQLFDRLGKTVFETSLNGHQFVLPRNHYAAGAYGWRITDGKGELTDSGVLIFH